MPTTTPTDALSTEILELKEKLNAVILVHNYQVPEIQEIGDYVGIHSDSRSRRLRPMRM